jgi:hypothetical protein
MNPIRRFNKWYDSLREPKRILTFFGLMGAWQAPLFIGNYLNHGGLVTVGIIGLILMLIIALDRI